MKQRDRKSQTETSVYETKQNGHEIMKSKRSSYSSGLPSSGVAAPRNSERITNLTQPNLRLPNLRLIYAW